MYLGFPDEFVCSSIILQVGYVGCIWGFPISQFRLYLGFFPIRKLALWVCFCRLIVYIVFGGFLGVSFGVYIFYCLVIKVGIRSSVVGVTHKLILHLCFNCVLNSICWGFVQVFDVMVILPYAFIYIGGFPHVYSFWLYFGILSRFCLIYRELWYRVWDFVGPTRTY